MISWLYGYSFVVAGTDGQTWHEQVLHELSFVAARVSSKLDQQPSMTCSLRSSRLAWRGWRGKRQEARISPGTERCMMYWRWATRQCMTTAYQMQRLSEGVHGRDSTEQGRQAEATWGWRRRWQRLGARRKMTTRRFFGQLSFKKRGPWFFFKNRENTTVLQILQY